VLGAPPIQKWRWPKFGLFIFFCINRNFIDFFIGIFSIFSNCKWVFLPIPLANFKIVTRFSQKLHDIEKDDFHSDYFNIPRLK